MKQVTASVLIQADLQTVWETMVNISRYSDWNPFIIHVGSASDFPHPGTLMTFTVCWDNGATQSTKELVDFIAPPSPTSGMQRAEWGYSFSGFLSKIGMVRAQRVQTLTATPEGHTLYHTVETFRGWGQLFLPLKKVQNGFDRQAEALKTVCEHHVEASLPSHDPRSMS